MQGIGDAIGDAVRAMVIVAVLVGILVGACGTCAVQKIRGYEVRIEKRAPGGTEGGAP